MTREGNPISADEAGGTLARRTANVEADLNGRWLIAARIAWVAAASLTLALSAVGFVAGLQNWQYFGSRSIYRAINAAGLPVTPVSVLGLLIPYIVFAATGIVIFLRRSRNWPAMFFALTLIAFTANRPLLAVERAVPTLGPAVEAVWLLTVFLFFTVLFVFPNGRFVPRWTRFLMLGAVPVAVMVSASMRVVFMMPDRPPAGAIGGVRVAVSIMVLYFGAGLVAQVHRFRAASDSVERQQIKLVGFAISAVSIAMLFGFAVPASFVDTGNAWFAWGMLAMAPMLLLVPVSVAVAVFRYQLFAIDRIISRTLTYTALTLVLAAVYISTVMLLAPVLGGRSNISVAGATLAVAMVFRPVQRRLQDLVDRRFNRRRYDVARTIEQFGVRLQDELNVGQMERELLGVVRDTLQPTAVSLWAVKATTPRTSNRRAIPTARSAR